MNIIKLILVSLNLQLRTFIWRIGFKKIFRKIESYKNKRIFLKDRMINQDLLNKKDYIFKDYALLKRQVTKSNEKWFIFNKEIDFEKVASINKINYSDYLYIYTFFYMDYKFSDINNEIYKRICSNKICNEPYVISQQIFNHFALASNELIISNNKYLFNKYKILRCNIEYHVDGNHVLDNLFSLSIYDLFTNKDIRYLLLLKNELERQTFKNSHKEKNLKYSFEILIKISCIIKALDLHKNKKFKEIKNYFSLFQKIYLEELQKEARYYPIIHDNISGDILRNNVLNFVDQFKIKSSGSHPNVLKNSRPLSGFTGHSFDSNFKIRNKSIKPFGTITYSDNSKREYQKLRINNLQPCFTKYDKNRFFWKSFRTLFALPCIKYNLGKTIFVYELIKTKTNLKLIHYSVEEIKNEIIYKSKNEFIFRFRIDKKPQIIKINNINSIKVNNLIIKIKGDNIKLKKSVRANNIDKYVKTYIVDIKSKFLSITE